MSEQPPHPIDRQIGISRRAVLRRSFVGGAGLGAAAVAGWAPVRAATVPTHGVYSATANQQAAEPTMLPALPVTAPEISLHPAGMPRSADSARYIDGEYLDLAERTGAMDHEIRVASREVVAEVVPCTTMNMWTFHGHIPGPMIRVRSATPWTTSSRTTRRARCRMPPSLDCGHPPRES